VNYTYKQEFVVNIVSNPFFSSSSVLSNAPLSKLEVSFYNLSNFTQRASDISMFPNVIKDPYNNAAFWPVNMKPETTIAAGEIIPPSKMESGAYYYDPATNEVMVFFAALCSVIKVIKDGTLCFYSVIKKIVSLSLSCSVIKTR
jgi:hypothetical protein